MADDFCVCKKETSHQFLELQLFGGFDASSACELINLLDESIKNKCKVAINTDGLRTISAFGLDVFLPWMSRLGKARMTVELTGRFSTVFDDR